MVFAQTGKRKKIVKSLLRSRRAVSKENRYAESIMPPLRSLSNARATFRIIGTESQRAEMVDNASNTITATETRPQPRQQGRHRWCAAGQ